MLLTSFQAETVYNMMCTMNIIGAKIQVRIAQPGWWLQIAETEDGTIRVAATDSFMGSGIRESDMEVYSSQQKFAEAYCLDKPF